MEQNGAREVPWGDIGGPNGAEDGQEGPGLDVLVILGGFWGSFWRSFWGHFLYFLASFFGLGFGIDVGIIFNIFGEDGTRLGNRTLIL